MAAIYIAAVAAHMAGGVEPSSIGHEAPAIVELPWPEPHVGQGRIEGEVLLGDRFGNLITNVPAALMADMFGDAGVLITLGGRPVGGRARGYAGIEGHLGAVINGTGLLEIAVHEGSAAALTGGRRSDRVVVTGRI